MPRPGLPWPPRGNKLALICASHEGPASARASKYLRPTPASLEAPYSIAAPRSSSPTQKAKPGPTIDRLLRQLAEAYESLVSDITSLRNENALLQGISASPRLDGDNDIQNGETSFIGNDASVRRLPMVDPAISTSLGPHDTIPNKDPRLDDDPHTQVDTAEGSGTELTIARRVEHALAAAWTNGLEADGLRSDLVAQSEMLQVPKSALKPMTPVEVYNGRMAVLISLPGSKWRLTWDLMGLILIFFDLIMIPLNVFEPPETPVTNVMDWFVLLFWTVNVPLTLQVGYVVKGRTVMNPYKILKHYLKTWFVLDVCVLLPDWMLTIQKLEESRPEASGGGGEAVKLLRVLRLTKCLRLLRAAKLKRLWLSFTDRIDSEYTGILMNIGKMIVLLLIVNHYIASMWFAVGTVNSSSWVYAYQYDRVNWAMKYCVSFHWAITQFTPASKVNVQPTNIGERMFAIFVVVFALVGFSYIVGCITGSLSQLRSMSEHSEQQFWQVRRYLRQNGVSPTLGSRIHRFLEHAYTKARKRVDSSSIEIFDLLSESLRSELQTVIALPHMKVHPLFLQLSMTFMPTLQRLAITCISYKAFAHGDVLFFPGERATHMYFLVAGLLEYRMKAGPASMEQTEWVENHEDWIAEPVVWTDCWVHVGRPTAMMESECLLINPAGFQEVVRLTPSCFDMVSNYARGFVTWLNSSERNITSDIQQGEVLKHEFAKFLPLDASTLDVEEVKLYKMVSEL